MRVSSGFAMMVYSISVSIMSINIWVAWTTPMLSAEDYVSMVLLAGVVFIINSLIAAIVSYNTTKDRQKHLD